MLFQHGHDTGALSEAQLKQLEFLKDVLRRRGYRFENWLSKFLTTEYEKHHFDPDIVSLMLTYFPVFLIGEAAIPVFSIVTL